MPKIYKLSENQIALVSEHIKKQKMIAEDLTPDQIVKSVEDDLSDIAKNFHKQNGSQPIAPEVTPVEKEIPPMDPAKLSNLANELGQLGVTPDVFTKAAAISGTTAPVPPVAPEKPVEPQIKQQQSSASGIFGEDSELNNIGNETPSLITDSAMSNFDGDFNTVISSNNIDIFYIKTEMLGFPVDDGAGISTEGEVTITWSLDIDRRSDRVNSIYILIQKFDGSLIFKYDDANGQEHSVEIEINKLVKDWDIINEMEVKETILPYEIELDFKFKKMIIK